MNAIAQRLSAATLLGTSAATCPAQWSVTNLHPPGAAASRALGVSADQEVGSVDAPYERAALWSGSASSWVDLQPVEAVESRALAVDGGLQAGWAALISAGYEHALLWAGSAASWVDLHPPGAPYGSMAYGVHGAQQVGGVFVPPNQARLWNGQASSWVNLHPPGAGGSFAYAISPGQQVGWAGVGGQPHASLWSGAAASWVDLDPGGTVLSYATGVHAGQQVGYVLSGSPGAYVSRASLWTGTAGSWTDLTPVGAAASLATGVHSGQQVGSARVGGVWVASLWTGTAASWVNLHAFLPGAFAGSDALAVWSGGGVTRVVGLGFNTATNRNEALLWTRVSCYADCTGEGSLTVADFGCFQTKFVAADPYADCNGDLSLTVADFGCFQTKFVAGCP